MKVIPPTSACTSANGGTVGWGWLTFPHQPVVHIRFLVKFGSTFPQNVAAGGGGLINKFLLMDGPSRISILGFNCSDTSGRYCAFGVLNSSESYAFRSPPNRGWIEDALFRVTASSHVNEWIAVEYVLNQSTGYGSLYLWTPDGTYNGIYIENVPIDTSPQMENFYMSYFNCYGLADANNYYLIDNYAISTSYIGPPSGFVGDDVTAPTLSTKTIAANGTTLTLAFNETVSIGAGGNGGWTISPSGGAATLAYSSGSGTSSLVYTISRPIQFNETATVSYTQPTDGVEDTTGNDLVTFSGSSVTNSSTQGQDTTPTQFTFTDVTGATRSTVYTSNQITVAGINSAATVTITNGTYSKNGAGYTSGAGTAVLGDNFTVQHTSSASYSTAVNTTLTIGGVSDIYTTTTLADPGDVTAPTVTSISVNGSIATINFSETVVTTGYDTGDFNLDCTSPTLTDVALSSPSGSGASRTFTIATPIVYGQVCNLDYVGSTNDIEDAAGNDMIAFSNMAVTNNTPQSGGTPEHSTSDVGGIVLRGVKK